MDKESSLEVKGTKMLNNVDLVRSSDSEDSAYRKFLEENIVSKSEENVQSDEELNRASNRKKPKSVKASRRRRNAMKTTRDALISSSDESDDLYIETDRNEAALRRSARLRRRSNQHSAYIQPFNQSERSFDEKKIDLPDIKKTDSQQNEDDLVYIDDCVHTQNTSNAILSKNDKNKQCFIASSPLFQDIDTLALIVEKIEEGELTDSQKEQLATIQAIFRESAHEITIDLDGLTEEQKEYVRNEQEEMKSLTFQELIEMIKTFKF